MTADRPLAPWLSLVGIGEDGVTGLSPAAVERVTGASLVVGGQRHLILARPLIRGERIAWMSPIEETIPRILARRGEPVCILATGDPFHYGIGSLLMRHVPATEMRCWPQPSAFSLAAARMGWSLQDCTCVSLHGRDLARIIPALQQGARVFALSWDGTTPDRLARLLGERGYGASRLVVCEAMGSPHERVRETSATEFELRDVADLNTIAVEVRADSEARTLPSTPGLPDTWFDHDGQITKSPVRAMTLSALAPHRGEILWDVGAGSGSISVEWLLSQPTTRAFAIEKHEGRRARIERNAACWGAQERLHLVSGEAPAALHELPQPDALFIGGGLTTPGLFEACRDALKSGGRLVANVVTIESQALLSDAFRRWGGDLLTLSIAQAEKVGGFHGMRPAMPVTQWRWVKP